MAKKQLNKRTPADESDLLNRILFGDSEVEKELPPNRQEMLFSKIEKLNNQLINKGVSQKSRTIVLKEVVQAQLDLLLKKANKRKKRIVKPKTHESPIDNVLKGILVVPPLREEK